MKGRESGMPDEAYWNSFFDAGCIVSKLECVRSPDDVVVELGSGYGTFTFAVAARTSGAVYALDIDPLLVALVEQRAAEERLSNVRAQRRDFVADGTGLPNESIDHVMAYNLLHIEQPVELLREAFRVLRPGGTMSIIHWKHDPSTPRGPSMEIRPRPEQCRAWAEQAGFEFIREQDLSSCCKYHYGLLLKRPEEGTR